MVNASLNWGSIVGIVLCVGGAMLYFMRSFKPALARDYDVFFAAIGLLCGGVFFFQGWRLDPILQFGVFLLAGTTIFFAYESVRLRGVAVEGARRSSYFDDEPAPSSINPAGGLSGGWDESYDRFEEPQPLRRRFSSRDGDGEDADRSEGDLYRPRRTSRAAIPEQAASRRRGNQEDESWSQDSERSRRMARFGRQDDEGNSRSNFGERRNTRQDQRRGSRPSAKQQTTSRRQLDNDSRPKSRGEYASSTTPGVPQGSPIRSEAEDAAYSPAKPRSTGTRPAGTRPTTGTRSSKPQAGPPANTQEAAPPSSSFSESRRSAPRSSRPRDNSSRFDD
ncbi:MAG TPA: Ycf66 family protein [Prochlorococcus sp.]